MSFYIYIYYYIFYAHLIYILLFLTVFGFTKFMSTQKGKYKIGKYNKLLIRYKQNVEKMTENIAVRKGKYKVSIR